MFWIEKPWLFAPFISSPVSVEFEDELPANCVQEDEVEDEDVKDTTGRLADGKDALVEIFRFFGGSSESVTFLLQSWITTSKIVPYAIF